MNYTNLTEKELIDLTLSHDSDSLVAELARRLEAYEGIDDELEEAQGQRNIAKADLEEERIVCSSACDDVRDELAMIKIVIDDEDNEADELQEIVAGHIVNIRTHLERIEF